MCSRCNSFSTWRSALASSTLSYSPAYRNIGLSLTAYSPLLLCTTHFSYTAIYSQCRRALITQCSVSPRGFLPELVHAKDSPPLAPPANLCSCRSRALMRREMYRLLERQHSLLGKLCLRLSDVA